MFDNILNIFYSEALSIVKKELEPHRELGIDIEIIEYNHSKGELIFEATLYDNDDPFNESGFAHDTQYFLFTVCYRHGYSVKYEES